MVFELDAEGQIARIRPHLRALAAMILFFLMIGPRYGADAVVAAARDAALGRRRHGRAAARRKLRGWDSNPQPLG